MSPSVSSTGRSNEPAPPPLAAPPLVGANPAEETTLIEQNPRRVWDAYQLAAGLCLLALFGSGPAIWEIARYAQQPEDHVLARWAYLVIAVSGLQLAYVVYIVQLPDWTSIWVVTIMALASAALYAMLLAISLFASPHSALLGSLQLSEHQAGHRAALWCLSMIGANALFAFFAGRLSARWRTEEELAFAVANRNNLR